MIDVRIFSMPAKASSALMDDYYHQSIVFISLTNSGGRNKDVWIFYSLQQPPFLLHCLSSPIYHHRFASIITI